MNRKKITESRFYEIEEKKKISETRLRGYENMKYLHDK